MNRYSTVFVTLSLFTFMMQGCNNSENNSTTYATNIGSAVSITTDDKNALMAPSVHALEAVADKIAKILKNEIVALNQKEAIHFTTEMDYCEISGTKEFTLSGELQHFSNNILYNNCQTEGYLHHGNVKLTYTQTNDEGKYPKGMTLLAITPYSVNDMIIEKEFLVSGEILYNSNKTVKNLQLKINGEVNYDHQHIKFKDFKQQVLF